MKFKAILTLCLLSLVMSCGAADEKLTDEEKRKLAELEAAEENGAETASDSNSNADDDGYSYDQMTGQYTVNNKIYKGMIQGQIYWSIEQITKNERPFSLGDFSVYLMNQNVAVRGTADFSNGEFRFINIPLGKYLLYATTGNDNNLWIAHYTIEFKNPEGMHVGILHPRYYRPKLKEEILAEEEAAEAEAEDTEEAEAEDTEDSENVESEESVATEEDIIEESGTGEITNDQMIAGILKSLYDGLKSIAVDDEESDSEEEPEEIVDESNESTATESQESTGQLPPPKGGGL